MSRAGGRDVAVAMRDCGIPTTSQIRPICKHCFSALPIDKTLSVEAQIGLLWRSFCSSSWPGVGLKRKTPRGWIQIGESRTRGVARIQLGLKPSRDSRATSQLDSPIWIQPLGFFRYKFRFFEKFQTNFDFTQMLDRISISVQIFEKKNRIFFFRKFRKNFYV